MGSSSFTIKYPIVPHTEFRCVWMSAGVLSYQLCDRNFECEQCLLDRALRKEIVADETNRQVVLQVDAIVPGEGVALQPNLKYDPRHFWLKEEDEKRVVVGLEAEVVSKFLSPRAVILPSVGDTVSRDKICCWIVIEGGTLPLLSPVSGKVTASNVLLNKNPHLLLKDSWGEGWLFEVDQSGESTERLKYLHADDAQKTYAEDQRQFMSLVSSHLSMHQSVAGYTLADGGVPLDRLSEVLGPTRYCQALCEVYFKIHMQS